MKIYITCIQELYDIGKHLKETIKYAFPINEEYDTHQMVAVYMIIANKLVGEKIKSSDSNNVLLRMHHNNNNHNINFELEKENKI